MRDDGGTLVLTDWLGNMKAREGDTVKAGGGEIRSGTFSVCGQFDVEARPST